MDILRFQPDTILTASQLNNILSGIDTLESRIPNISKEDIEREQQRLQRLIEDAKTNINRIEQLISQYNYQELVNGIAALNEFKELSKLDIEEAKAKIEEAKLALEEASKQLEELAGSGEAGSSIQATLAKISEFATWYDENKEYINNYQGLIDMIAGTKEELLTKINTTDQTVTELGLKYDLQQGTIETHASQINTNTDAITSAQTVLNGIDASITNKVTQVVGNELTSVEERLSATEGNYTVLVGTVNENSENISSLSVSVDNIKSQVLSGEGTTDNPYKISSSAINIDSITNTVISAVEGQLDDKIMNSSTIQQLNNSINMVVSSGTTNGTTWTPNVSSAAIIAAITDKDGHLNSSITLSADTITLLGETVATNLNAIDLTIGGGSSQFKKDGSGHVANTSLSWDKNGTISLNGVSKNLSVTIEDLILRLTSQQNSGNSIINNFSKKYINIPMKAGARDPRYFDITITKNGAFVYAHVSANQIDIETSGTTYTSEQSKFLLLGILPKKDLQSVHTASEFKFNIKADGTMLMVASTYSSSTQFGTYEFDFFWIVEDEVEVSKTIGTDDSGENGGYRYVDLGLDSGTKWSICNYGSGSKSNAGTSLLSWGNTKITTSTYYQAYPDNKVTSITDSNDIVNINWGNKWRTPTGEQMKEMIQGCSWDAITIDDVDYVRGISKKNGNVIYFPKTTIDSGNGWQVPFAYWTKTPGNQMVNGTGEKPVTLNTACVGYVRYAKTPEASFTNIAINRYAYVRPCYK